MVTVSCHICGAEIQRFPRQLRRAEKFACSLECKGKLSTERLRERWGSAESRFWLRVTKTDTCWIWAPVNKRGYGYIMDRGNRTTVHRYAYELLVGAIPEGYDIDHLCRNPSCVNPEHLEAVTRKENYRRGNGPTLVRDLRARVAALEQENQELRARLGEYVL